MGAREQHCGGPLIGWGFAALCLFATNALASSPSAPTDSLTVRGCAVMAASGSLETQAARWSALALVRDAAAASRNAAPRFSAQSGVMLAPSGFYDPATTDLGHYDLRLVMERVLLDGGQLRRDRERIAAAAASGAADLTSSTISTALEAARLASALLLAREHLARRRDDESWTARVLDAVRSGARVGVRSPSDVVRLELDLRTSSMARADLESERATLGRALGALLLPDAVGASFLAVRDTTWTDTVPSAADSEAAIFRTQSNGEVRRAEAAAEITRVDLASARATGAAHLGLALDAGVQGTNLTRLVPPEIAAANAGAGFGDRLRRDLGASVRLDLQMPLHTPGGAATVSAREADMRAASLRVQQARIAARLASLDLLARWNDHARRLADADVAASLADSNLLRMRSLYLAGSTTLLDLFDARRARQDMADLHDALRSEMHLIVVESEIMRGLP